MNNLDAFIKEEVTKILLDAGIPVNLQGYRCLQSSVAYVIRQPSLLRGVTKKLYPMVGKNFGISGSVVERSMRHAAEIAFIKTQLRSICGLFGIPEENWTYKPSNSEIIALIAEHVRLKAQKEGLMPCA